MFVDASAIVAILTNEPEADILADAVDNAYGALTSPLAIFEAVLAIRRRRQSSVDEAHEDVRQLIELAQILVVPISSADADAALIAFSRYGKGQGHQAQLNLGDCFAYAAAKLHNVPLLFKGDDFSKTDIVPAYTP